VKGQGRRMLRQRLKGKSRTLLFPRPGRAQGRNERQLLSCDPSHRGHPRQRGYKIKKGGLLRRAQEADPGISFLESNVATWISSTLKPCVPSDPVISLPTIYPEQKNQERIKDLMCTKMGITENLRVKNWEEPSIMKKVSKNDSRQTMEAYTAIKIDETDS